MPDPARAPQALPLHRARHLLEELHRLDAAVYQELTAVVQQSGYPELTIAHARVLMRTPQTVGVRMGQVAHRLGITRGALTQLVAQLEEIGLVLRTRDSTDGRGVIVRATPRSRPVYDAAQARVSELVAGLSAAVGEDRWEAFTEVLAESVMWQEERAAALSRVRRR